MSIAESLSHLHVGDTNKEKADFLEAVDKATNEGRGLSFLRTVITYLRREQFDHARQVYFVDADKVHSEPEAALALFHVFGCRLHGDHECQDSLCNDLLEHQVIRVWLDKALGYRDGDD
jgi:hypothetical protein